jgi:DNA-binding transcriptional MocR family regulator
VPGPSAPELKPPKVTPAALLAAVGDWRDEPRPAFRALAAAIAAAADRGDLPTGAMLPPERRLAEAMAVSRGMVVAAYDVLRADGVVLRRQGAGTWLPAAGVPTEAWTDDQEAGLRARRLAARVVSPLAGAIDLGISALPEPWGLTEHDLAVTVDDLAAAAGHGYLPLGLPALRAAVAARCTAAGWPTTSDEVAITLGVQHGIALAARLLLHPGDLVAVESPSYPGAIDLLARSGAHFVTLGTDSGGAKVDALERHAAGGPDAEGDDGLRLAYLVPTCHNPMGTVMPDHRRREIAGIVDQHADLWLVEDEALAPLRFGGPPPLPIAAHGRSDRHLVLGSFAKAAWAGLRVGWIRGSAGAIARLGRLSAAVDLGSSALSQLIAVRTIDHLDADLERLRPVLAAQAAHLRAALTAALPDWQVNDPEGGLSLWCRLPRGTGDDLAAAGIPHGVSVLPGSAASVDEVHLDHVRISFAHPPAVLDTAVDRLTLAWKDLTA